MTPWIVIAVAVLGAGCEQLKSPRRIHELEGRVDALSSELAAIKARPASKLDQPAADHGGSAAASATIEAPAGAHDGDQEAAAAPGTPDDAKHDDARQDEAKQDDAKQDDAKQDDAKRDDSRRDAKRDDAKRDDAKRDDAKRDDGRRDAKRDDAKRDDAKRDDAKRDDARRDDAKRDDAKRDEAKRDDAKRDDPKRDDAKRDDVAKREAAAMDHLLAVVSKNTATPKPHDPGVLHWGYDAKVGPPTWGTLDPAWSACLNGKTQSPIDIEPKAGTATPIVFHYKPTAATIIDNGHTLQVNLATGSSIDIDAVSYDLLELHFHTPSEHTIAGEHYPLEVQLVHRDGAGKLAVISVLYDLGAESKALGGLWAAWPRKVGAEDRLKKPFDPSALLPETRTVYRYTGSLTTPPCTEGVVWNVMRRTPSDTKAHFDAFGAHYKANARDLQPVGDRKIQ